MHVDIIVGLDEIEQFLIHAGKTAPGIDGIMTKVLRACWSSVKRAVLPLFRLCLRQGQYLGSFCTAEVTFFRNQMRGISAHQNHGIALPFCLFKGKVSRDWWPEKLVTLPSQKMCLGNHNLGHFQKICHWSCRMPRSRYWESSLTSESCLTSCYVPCPWSGGWAFLKPNLYKITLYIRLIYQILRWRVYIATQEIQKKIKHLFSNQKEDSKITILQNPLLLSYLHVFYIHMWCWE